MSVDQKKPKSNGAGTSLSIVIARLIWIFFGPLALMLLLMSMASKGRGWFTGFDLTYFVVLVFVIWTRWKEQRSGVAMTVYGEPATPAHFRRYIFVTVPLAITLWAGAKALGNYVWKDA